MVEIGYVWLGADRIVYNSAGQLYASAANWNMQHSVIATFSCR